MLYALKGSGKRAFYRWLVRDWRPFFPGLPDRTRLSQEVKAEIMSKARATGSQW